MMEYQLESIFIHFCYFKGEQFCQRRDIVVREHGLHFYWLLLPCAGMHVLVGVAAQISLHIKTSAN